MELRIQTELASLFVLVGMGTLVACGGSDDCSNATGDTWKDPTSGLTWQVTPTGSEMDLWEAESHCAELSLDGGGWHLPTIGELRTLIRGCPATKDGGSCTIEEGDCLDWSCWVDSCASCAYGGGPGEGGMYWPDEIKGDCCWYRSSSPLENCGDCAWLVHFGGGGVGSGGDNGGVVYGDNDAIDNHVRCVR